MTHKPFSLNFINHIISIVRQLHKRAKDPLIAAFDADGTLWDGDVGNLFFRYQVKHPLVKVPQKLLQDYEAFYFHDPKKALRELAF